MNIPHVESFGEIILKGPCTKVWTKYREAMLDGAVVRATHILPLKCQWSRCRRQSQGNIHPEFILLCLYLQLLQVLPITRTNQMPMTRCLFMQPIKISLPGQSKIFSISGEYILISTATTDKAGSPVGVLITGLSRSLILSFLHIYQSLRSW